MMKTYDEAVRWLYGLQKYGMKFGLQNTRTLCRLFGNPQNAVPAVHVAGTNGKGSTAAYITAIAGEAGLTCGLTTSPHLVNVTERFRLGEEEITQAELLDLVNRFKDTVDAYNRKYKKEMRPTFFETTLVMAWIWFRERKADLMVVETGLGGRLDSSNVLKPLLSVITSIGIEHTEYLGHTLEAIAREKAGIVKAKRPVLTAADQPGALEVIRKRAEKLGAPLEIFGRDFMARRTAKSFDYTDEDGRMRRLSTRLQGDYQARNLALAVRAAKYLGRMGFSIDDRHIRKGLAATRWPGRLERFEFATPWLVDCAHNPAAVEALSAYLEKHYGNRRILAVVAAMRDKDYPQMFRTLSPRIRDWIFTQPVIDRAEKPENLGAACPAEGRKIRRKSVRAALKLARDLEADYDLVLVAGSIFLVGEADPWIRSRERENG